MPRIESALYCKNGVTWFIGPVRDARCEKKAKASAPKKKQKQKAMPNICIAKGGPPRKLTGHECGVTVRLKLVCSLIAHEFKPNTGVTLVSNPFPRLASFGDAEN